MATYSLRTKERKNYREMADVRLPRPERVCNADKLYPIEVLERDGGRVKIHYVGYSDIHDEWRSEEDVSAISAPGALQMERYQPFCHYKELAYAIKAALRSAMPRRDPDVRIEIPFDELLYNGGLKQAGSFVRNFRGNEVYQIQSYSDLVPLLGKWWYIRIFNEQQDFCAAKLETVLFHLSHRAVLKEFSPDDGTLTPLKGGSVLTFKFVRVDGVRRQLQDYLDMN